ncbi:hypothetical protein O997_03610 [Anaplasma phagocytophilum str. MRK]|uniref:phage terminase large subunit n=1 Tax=Anaplasma phagocytophilum TaxID=948 RepID=UPI0005339890|nr:hypothetical protein O997_03610 [Anaplasma phagocytophilum str. MRK]
MQFTKFIKLVFETVSPGSTYVNNWHIRVMADRLQAAHEGKIKRLIVNVPPRMMKSICVSVAWPAWILGFNPCARIIVASYSQLLSEKLSLDTKCVLQSSWYRAIFPEVEISKLQNSRRKFITTKLGYRMATSVGGTVTGEGGDVLIVDDPLNPMQASSSKYRRRVFDWFKESFLTRINDRKKGIVVIVMHRLHTEDLSAQVLATSAHKTWHHLSIPFIAEKRATIFSLNRDYGSSRCRVAMYKRSKNEPIIKNLGSRYIEGLKNEVGVYAFSSQYQQKPINIGNSGIIRKGWLKRYHSDEFDTTESCIIQSWDTASTLHAHSNFSVCITLAIRDGSFFLLDVYRAKANYTELKKRVLHLSEHWKPDVILIEERSSGYQLLQEMSKKLPVIAFNPKKYCKLSRLLQIIPTIQKGHLFVPHYAPWLYDFESEICAFPNGENDDQVDSLTQAFNWYRDQGVSNIEEVPECNIRFLI